MCDIKSSGDESISSDDSDNVTSVSWVIIDLCVYNLAITIIRQVRVPIYLLEPTLEVYQFGILWN